MALDLGNNGANAETGEPTLRFDYSASAKLTEAQAVKHAILLLVEAARKQPHDFSNFINYIKNRKPGVDPLAYKISVFRGAEEALQERLLELADSLVPSKKKIAPEILASEGKSVALFNSVSGLKRSVIAEQIVSDEEIRSRFLAKSAKKLEKLEAKIVKQSSKARPVIVEPEGVDMGAPSLDKAA